MTSWSDAGTWRGDGLQREVFYFGPQDERLYGSLYAAESTSRPSGIVVCPSWGVEADRTERLAHALALAIARMGGAGFVYHHPGHGDSYGDLSTATLDSLAAAAAVAISEAGRRRPDLSWFPAGLMLGASIACLAAARQTDAANRLLLVQPALRPSAYVARLARSLKQVTLSSGRVLDMSFGYPLPVGLASGGERADAAVAAALAAFDGDGAIVRCAKPGRDELAPDSFEDVVADASWRFGVKDYPELEATTVDWLDRRTRDPIVALEKGRG